MKRIEIKPDGWPIMIEECPPGHFMYEGELCFKTEYMSAESDYKDLEVFCASGETFMPRKVLVQPVSIEEVEGD